MKDICKNCGAWHGLHKWDNDQCPRNGVEASYPKKQEYQNTYYQEDNSDELAALTARVKELEEAIQEAAEALGDAQGEWGCTNKAYAPEWTHPLKDAEEAALETLKGKS